VSLDIATVADKSILYRDDVVRGSVSLTDASRDSILYRLDNLLIVSGIPTRVARRH
jgi:hypothetical protein